VNKRIEVAAILAVLTAASVHAQATYLFGIVMRGTPQEVQAVIDKGEDVNAREPSYGGTALMWAALHNRDTEVLAVLLNAGADVNAQNKVGATALMLASHNQNPDVITTLLEAGADPNLKDNAGKTALVYAQGNEQLKGTDALKKLEEASN
jgi:uncharacterized protein